MPKFIITWNIGYGDNAEIVEADNQDEAVKMAYESWMEDADSSADYQAMPFDKDIAFNYGLIDEDD